MNEFFKKVHLSDKKKVFKKIAIEQAILLVKTDSIDVQQITGSEVIEEKLLVCTFLVGKEFTLKDSEMATVSVHFEEDKYFFYGLLAFVGEKIYLDIQGDLFYLQRRKSARLELPEGYNKKCKILDFNGKILPFDCDVIDISSGGCRLGLSSLEPIIKSGSILKLKISLGNRSSFEVKGEVRHAKPIKDFSDLPQTLGIQYLDLEIGFEVKMLNLYMDVQREIFLKFIKK